MPAPRTRLLAVLAVVAATALAGCAPADATPPTPTPTLEPVFASDEEALAAAIAAYEAYAEMSQIIGEDGGDDPERIRPFVGEAFAATAIEEFEQLEANSLRLVGAVHVQGGTLAEWGQAGEVFVTAYLCTDVSATRVLNASDVDVTPSDRADHLTLVVEFTGTDDERQLIVESSDLWSGPSTC